MIGGETVPHCMLDGGGEGAVDYVYFVNAGRTARLTECQ